jgi:competence protein ComEA
LNNPNWENEGDGRMIVVLCVLFSLLLSDFMSSSNISFLNENRRESHYTQLHFVKPDMLIVEKSPVAGGGDVPAKYTPFLFELIPINSADKDMLMTVNGIGPAMAENIILYRQKFGRFKTSLDLENLHGVGPKRAAQLASVFTFKEKETIP